MKKWTYVIVPAIMLALFLFFYNQKMAELDQRERERAAQIEKQKAADAEHKKATELKARQDADKRAADQAAELAAAEKEKNDKWNAETKKILDQTNQAASEADKYSKMSAQLEIDLDNLHKQKEQLSREDFDLLKKVEQERVAQRNAQLEIQRMVAMIAKRAEESTLAKAAPVPPPAKS